jgi:NAD(P)-dependent dehydrogenase (short-subunit alcohol dehydrogenase family)
MEFKDKRVLITGGSRGIGFGIAEAFLAEGARVAINGRTPESANAAVEILGPADRVIAAPGDIAKVAGCELAVQTAVDAFGGLDILVNSAGIGSGRPMAECDEEMYDRHADVNLKGLFFCCRAAMPELKKSQGNIVNISSDAALEGMARIVVYCGLKAGVNNMTRAMALEVAPDKVRVNAVCPGYVDTDMIRRDWFERIGKDDPEKAKQLEQDAIDYAPLKRLGTVTDIANGVLYLASDKASFVTGIELTINGGATAGK